MSTVTLATCRYCGRTSLVYLPVLERYVEIPAVRFDGHSEGVVIYQHQVRYSLDLEPAPRKHNRIHACVEAHLARMRVPAPPDLWEMLRGHWASQP